jgi:oligopeptide transport system permease protein
LIKLDLGPSFKYEDKTVNEIIKEGFPVSFILGISATFLAVVFGIFFGVISLNYVIYKHALRNSLTPVVSYLGPLLAGILTGSFVIENIFAIPGLGKYFVTSIYLL